MLRTPLWKNRFEMIAQFALRLLFGMSLTWAVLPRPQITSGFFRIQLLIGLGLSALAALTIQDWRVPAPPATESGAAAAAPMMSAAIAKSVCAAIAGCCFVGSVLWTLERRGAGTVCLFLILGAVGALLIGHAGSPVDVSAAMRIHRSASELAAGALVGSCVAAMLLGHWYLTAPTMSISPLGRANLWFAATLLVRLALAAWGLSIAGSRIDGPTHIVWMTLRWLAGLALPLLLCVMVARILRYRNTQSATGVLFASVILVFLGELAGTLLSQETGASM